MLCLESTTSVDSWNPGPYSSSLRTCQLGTRLFSGAIACCFLTPLLLCYYCCCSHITAAFTSPLVTSAFSGVAELTIQLLRLISILCVPLCRINKFGFYFPRRLLRSPILVGHQDYFLAPLPGTIALPISSLEEVLIITIIITSFHQESSTNYFLAPPTSSPGEYTQPLSLFLLFFVLSSLFLSSLFLFCFLLFSLFLFLFYFVVFINSKIHKNLQNQKFIKTVPWLVSLKLGLIGKVDPQMMNENIIRDTAYLKKGYTYGY